MINKVDNLPFYVFMGVEFIVCSIVQDKDVLDDLTESKIRKEIVDYLKNLVYGEELILSGKEIVDFTEEFIDIIKIHNSVLHDLR